MGDNNGIVIKAEIFFNIADSIHDGFVSCGTALYNNNVG